MDIEIDDKWVDDEELVNELQQLEDALDSGGQDVEKDIINLLTGGECSNNVDVGKPSIQKSLTPPKNSSSLVTPFVGMVFPSFEELETYFLAYGESQGFGVVRGNSTFKGKGDNKVKRCQTWKCECNGVVRIHKKKPNDVDGDSVEVPVVPHLSKKCGCPVQLHATLQSNCEWVVKILELEHKNHNPTPSKSKNIVAYRKLKFHPHIRRRVQIGLKAGITIRKILDSLSLERCGDVQLTDRDLRNVMDEERRKKMSEGDSNAMWQYFMKMYADKNDFFHEVRLDEDGVLKDALWIDARSRASYKDFGDVVCYDTTHCTNDYDFPFANFIGVNHHGQSILLGCALIRNETIESHEWVFKTWLKAMGGIAPQGILTDQAIPMRRGLESAMPQTRHRWCLWHIMKKWSTKLGMCTDFSTFGPMLKSVIYDSNDAKEFENRWLLIVHDYNLGSVDWLTGLYKERAIWVPAFTKHLFWAGMRSTQHIESIYSFFDDFVHKNTKFCEFAEGYCFAMETRCGREKDADDHCNVFTRSLSPNALSVEKFFQHIYTDKKFIQIQIECQRVALLCGPNEIVLNDEETDNIVHDRVYVHLGGKRDDVVTDKRRSYTVRFNKISHEASCECKLFECSGLLCRHIIKVFDKHEITKVPDMYVLKRWRKDVIRKHTLVKVAYHDPTKVEHVKRFDEIHVAFEPIATAAMVSEKASKLVLQTIKELHHSVSTILGDEEHDCAVNGFDAGDQSSVGINHDSCSLVGGTVNGTHCVDSPSSQCGASNNYQVLTATSNVPSIKDPTPRHKMQRGQRGGYARRKPIDEIILNKAQASAKARASGSNSRTNANTSTTKANSRTRGERVGAEKRNKGNDDTNVLVGPHFPIVNGVDGKSYIQLPTQLLQSYASNHMFQSNGGTSMPMHTPMPFGIESQVLPNNQAVGLFAPPNYFSDELELSIGTSSTRGSVERPMLPPIRSYNLRSDVSDHRGH